MIERVMRHVGVRVRSALAATLVVAFAYGLATTAFVYAYQDALVNNSDSAAVQLANSVVSEISRDGVDDRFLSAQSGPGDDAILQVVGARNKVLGGSDSLATAPPISRLRPGDGEIAREDRTLPGSDEEFRIVAIGVTTPDGLVVVLAGSSLQPVSDGVSDLVTLLSIGGPLLLLVVGAATFGFVGGALRPVEQIRRRVSVMSVRDLHSRVPVPAARDEVGKLAETMNEMLERLESSVRRQRRFVADASHELRSPLSTVQAGLELLRRTSSASDAEVVDMLYDETVRLDRLTSALLLLARVDERGLRLDIEDVDLDDLVDAERRRLATNSRVRVTAQVAAVRVRGDRHQLGQVLRNLTDNAERYADASVELRLWSLGGNAYLQVRDDGPGIPAEDRDQVFERFVRLDESRTRLDGGSGLGLAIVREVVAAHGGTVQMLNPERGTAVEVRLPLEADGQASASR
ncbi:ATP-binding protein [Fodinicola feengrottensis]|uniref:histidine kinase n=1 Tax=Fodinicola feengrottensis TaxID=435914 RepID=A0ABN2GGZ2_9ACTN